MGVEEMSELVREEGEGWRSSGPSRGPDKMIPFPLSFCLFSLAGWGESDREAPLGQHGCPGPAAGGAGRGWDMGKTCKSQPSLPWPFESLHVAG